MPFVRPELSKFIYIGICTSVLFTSYDPNSAENEIAELKLRQKNTPSLFQKKCYGEILAAAKKFEQGVDLNQPSEHGRYPLAAAVYLNSPELVDWLLEMGASPNMGSLLGDSLLCDVMILGSSAQGLSDVTVKIFDANCLKVFKSLCSEGANVNAKFQSGNPVVIEAMLTGSHELVELLLELGANGNVQDAYGNTLLHYACNLGDSKMLNHLMQYSLSLEIINHAGKSVGHILVANDNSEYLSLFYNKGLPINLKNNKGNTLLIDAVRHNAMNCLTLLLSWGANPNEVNQEGLTPLMIAAQDDNVEALAELLKYSADIDFTNDKGNSALMSALKSNSLHTTKLLLDAGANLTIDQVYNHRLFDSFLTNEMRSLLIQRLFQH